MNEEFEDEIPAHYLKNGKVVWYRILLNDDTKVTAYPDEKTRLDIKTNWIVKGTLRKVNDEKVKGWKILDDCIQSNY